jgi:hypothetical protein
MKKQISKKLKNLVKPVEEIIEKEIKMIEIIPKFIEPISEVQNTNETLISLQPHEQSWICGQILCNNTKIIPESYEKLLKKIKLIYELMINEAYYTPFPSNFNRCKRKIDYPLLISWKICSIRYRTASNFLLANHRKILRYYWKQLKYLNYVEHEAWDIPLPFDFEFAEFVSPPPIKKL